MITEYINEIYQLSGHRGCMCLLCWWRSQKLIPKIGALWKLSLTSDQGFDERERGRVQLLGLLSLLPMMELAECHGLGIGPVSRDLASPGVRTWEFIRP
jgi:hypothetical protein